MSNQKSLMWKEDNTSHWFTPGGDPVWICPVCGGGRHVYGIENANEPKTECPDCKTKIQGYALWEDLSE